MVNVIGGIVEQRDITPGTDGRQVADTFHVDLVGFFLMGLGFVDSCVGGAVDAVLYVMLVKEPAYERSPGDVQLSPVDGQEVQVGVLLAQRKEVLAELAAGAGD
jgi:hypothetical protein